MSMKFKFDKKIKNGYYSAVYFNKTCKIIKQQDSKNTILMQFIHFNKTTVKVCGIEEVITLLKYSLSKKQLKKISVFGVKDGDLINDHKPVLLIKGPYEYFGYLENVIDGILARRSSVATNCYNLLEVVNTDKVIFMADRTDDYLLQPYDGYAAYIGGIRSFVTKAQIAFIKDDPKVKVMGTIPHALIQQNDGDLATVLNTYSRVFPTDPIIALIDYHNDSISEIIKLADNFKSIYAVRIDTSSALVDKVFASKSIAGKVPMKYWGVNPTLVKRVREALDKYGFEETKIIISSNLDVSRIKKFVEEKAPVDIYGVGSALISRNVHFTADLVMKNDELSAKAGRKLFIPINEINKLKKYL